MADRRLSHGSPEGVDGGFGLAHQHVRGVTQLLASLHQTSCGLVHLPRPPADFRWKHRAVVDMRAEARAQIREASRTQMRPTPPGIRGELEQGEAATARRALGDRVIPAIKEEERTLFGAQRLGPPAIQVGQKVTAEHDRVVDRDRPRAQRTRPSSALHLVTAARRE